MSDQEQKIQNALNDFYCKRFHSIRQCALYNGIVLTTVAYQLRGRKSNTNSEHKNQCFTNKEKRTILQWLSDLQRQHISLNHLYLH